MPIREHTELKIHFVDFARKKLASESANVKLVGIPLVGWWFCPTSEKMWPISWLRPLLSIFTHRSIAELRTGESSHSVYVQISVFEPEWYDLLEGILIEYEARMEADTRFKDFPIYREFRYHKKSKSTPWSEEMDTTEAEEDDSTLDAGDEHRAIRR